MGGRGGWGKVGKMSVMACVFRSQADDEGEETNTEMPNLNEESNEEAVRPENRVESSDEDDDDDAAV